MLGTVSLYLGTECKQSAQRTGRSILHELSDAELDHLVGALRDRLPDGPAVDRDRWTLGRATREA